MKINLLLLTALLAAQFTLFAQPVRVIAFGAHPDDCDFRAGGTAILFSQMGHKVKFVSMTNGSKGHHYLSEAETDAEHKADMKKVADLIDIEYECMDYPDGELMPSIENRRAVIKMICDWKADIVITHRTNDYHPDHRYTSIIVQDAAYMISVPKMVPEGEALLKAPVFLYLPDNFTKPTPFSPDIVIDITPVAEKKIDIFDAHPSQVYEWMPWNGGYEDKLPKDVTGRRQYIAENFMTRFGACSDEFKQAALKWYLPEQLANCRYLEALEICEYGHRPTIEQIKELFPMLPK